MSPAYTCNRMAWLLTSLLSLIWLACCTTALTSNVTSFFTIVALGIFVFTLRCPVWANTPVTFNWTRRITCLILPTRWSYLNFVHFMYRWSHTIQVCIQFQIFNILCCFPLPIEIWNFTDLVSLIFEHTSDFDYSVLEDEMTWRKSCRKSRLSIDVVV